ncbi:creatininase family protein [Paenibacillus cremeus]|uniref:Creatininase family protein n=1 Tax=Paenibacillus cremeus TaxID=2163881 RepID=A0A559K8W3_9BACL|nr:creatininase family protein [Paenibacillus cremeus]TVY08571.1 creatininase family protein [Paenibacillus cremeus]
MLTMNNARPDFENADLKVAVLPIGAVEQHGSHLPVGTDTMISSEMAARVAERLGAYLLPPVAISSSIEHRSAKGTVYLKATTLALVVRDIAECLHEAGYEKLILINGHGGNWILKPTIRQLNRDLSGLETVLIHTSAGAERQQVVVDHKHHDIHAGEKETSIMLHLRPELVGQVKELNDKQFQLQDYMDYFDVMDLSEDGYWGFPESGTVEKGAKLMDIMVDGALQYLERLEAYHAKVRERKGE